MDYKIFPNRSIEKVLHFASSDNTPLVGKKFTFTLKNPAFLFGCGAFDSVVLAESKKVGRDTRFTEELLAKWTSLFNYGTLPFYWGTYEPVEGNTREEVMKEAAQYLVNHGAKVKGHPLCWHTVCADWLLKYDTHKIMDKQLDRIYREMTAFKGIIDIWDVINETVIMPVFDRYDNAVSRLCREYGRINLIKEVFDAAHSANPDATLLINDFDLNSEYVSIIDECLKAGVPINAIGLQSHQHQGYKGLKWVHAVTDRFSVFGLPLHFTENTLISGHLMPPEIVDLNDYQVDEWPSTPEGEERQKNEMLEMYTDLLSHPLVEAITAWDFIDGGWLKAPSGIVRFDGTVKPAYEMLTELIHNNASSEVTLVTDADGNINFNGIEGTYEISSEFGGTTCTLDRKISCKIMNIFV